jgi:hypothetical protein
MNNEMDQENGIWIELEKDQVNYSLNHARALKLSTVLMHLWGIDYAPITFSEYENAYRFKQSSSGSFLILRDNGHWFSLDYMAEKAKQLEPA